MDKLSWLYARIIAFERSLVIIFQQDDGKFHKDFTTFQDLVSEAFFVQWEAVIV